MRILSFTVKISYLSLVDINPTARTVKKRTKSVTLRSKAIFVKDVFKQRGHSWLIL